MTDEQLVLALITAYKNKGIDMSKLLDDPLFEKLPARVKIQAIQTHAQTIHDGIRSGFDSTDAKRVVVNSLFSGIEGALLGTGIMTGLAVNGVPLGMSTLKAQLLGAAALGAVGAFNGATKAMSQVDDRRGLKASLKETISNPSVENSIASLSLSHSLKGSRSLRDAILDRVNNMTMHQAKEHGLPILISGINAVDVEDAKLKAMG